MTFATQLTLEAVVEKLMELADIEKLPKLQKLYIRIVEDDISSYDVAEEIHKIYTN